MSELQTRSTALYQGWDRDSLRKRAGSAGEEQAPEAKRRKAVQNGFTAINVAPRESGSAEWHDSASSVRPKVPGASSDWIDPPPARRLRHRDPLLKDYLGLEPGAGQVSSPPFVNVAASPDDQLSRAASTAIRLTALQISSSKAKRLDVQRSSRTRRQPSADAKLWLVQPGVSPVHPSMAAHEPRPGKAAPCTTQMTQHIALINPPSAIEKRLESSTYRDHDSSDQSRSEVTGSTACLTDSSFDRLPVVVPQTAMNSLKQQQGFGFTLYKGVAEGLVEPIFPLLSSTSSTLHSVSGAYDVPANSIGVHKYYDQISTIQVRLADKKAKPPVSRPFYLPNISEVSEDQSPDANFPCHAITDNQNCARDDCCDFGLSGDHLDDFDADQIMEEPHRDFQSDTNTLHPTGSLVDDCGILTLLPSDAVEPNTNCREPSTASATAGQQDLNIISHDALLELMDELGSEVSEAAECSTPLCGASSRHQVVVSDDETAGFAPVNDLWIGPEDIELDSMRELDEVQVNDVQQVDLTQKYDMPSAGPVVVEASDSTSKPRNDVESIATKPYVRPPIPRAVRDRSPIVGAHTAVVLRTCFRVGEALNIGAQAVRTNASVLLELYARVKTSRRDVSSVKQHFTFTDLWSQKGPTLAGTYDCWKGSGLWDAESSLFLVSDGAKRICRCIARMRREKHEWKLAVLNIWEADWEDVEDVRDIIAA